MLSFSHTPVGSVSWRTSSGGADVSIASPPPRVRLSRMAGYARDLSVADAVDGTTASLPSTIPAPCRRFTVRCHVTADRNLSNMVIREHANRQGLSVSAHTPQSQMAMTETVVAPIGSHFCPRLADVSRREPWPAAKNDQVVEDRLDRPAVPGGTGTPRVAALPVARPAIEGRLGGSGSRQLRSPRLLVSDEALHLCRVAEAAVKEPLLGLGGPMTKPPLERSQPAHRRHLPPTPRGG